MRILLGAARHQLQVSAPPEVNLSQTSGSDSPDAGHERALAPLRWASSARPERTKRRVVRAKRSPAPNQAINMSGQIAGSNQDSMLKQTANRYASSTSIKAPRPTRSEPNLDRLVLGCAPSVGQHQDKTDAIQHRPLEAHAVAAFRQLALESFNSDLQSLRAVASAIQQQQQQQQYLVDSGAIRNAQANMQDQNRLQYSRQSSGALRQAHKCRRAYGMDRRAEWCKQCRWKKACTRKSS